MLAYELFSGKMGEIAIFMQQFFCLFQTFFLINLDAQSTIGTFPVMGNADILNADRIFSKQHGNGCKGTGLIGNFHMDRVGLLDRTTRSIDEGIPVITRFFKEVENFLLRRIIDQLFDILEGFNIMLQQDRNILLVCQTDLLPHNRRGGSNSGDVLKASGGNHFHSAFPGIGIPNQIDKGGGDHMGEVADRSSDIIVLLIGQNQGDGAQVKRGRQR